MKLLRYLLAAIISVYQKTLSPDHSFWAKKIHPHGFCKFYPSCSEYTKQSIIKKGVLKGVLKGIWRVIRCNPWGKGGIDLP